MRIGRIIDLENHHLWVCQEADGALTVLDGNLFGQHRRSGKVVQVQRWLSPVEPPAILCIGLNYRKHAEEGGWPTPGYPMFFMKNPAAVVGHLQPIVPPKVCDDEIDYEAELAVIISRPCRDVSIEEAMQYVLGYTIANDVSARLWQAEKGGSQWCRGKGFDTFAPLGPIMVTPDELQHPNSLAIKSFLNGKLMQNSSTADMIFDVPTLVSFLSQDTTLLPGTVILTGTPEGIGWAREPKVLLHCGDEITIEIEDIGRLTNPVCATAC